MDSWARLHYNAMIAQPCSISIYYTRRWLRVGRTGGAIHPIQSVSQPASPTNSKIQWGALSCVHCHCCQLVTDVLIHCFCYKCYKLSPPADHNNQLVSNKESKERERGCSDSDHDLQGGSLPFFSLFFSCTIQSHRVEETYGNNNLINRHRAPNWRDTAKIESKYLVIIYRVRHRQL